VFNNKNLNYEYSYKYQKIDYNCVP
jgi:hypothetical protein